MKLKFSHGRSPDQAYKNVAFAQVSGRETSHWGCILLNLRPLITWLEQDYSPEQIVGHVKINMIKCVSAERIYQSIWQDKKDGGDYYIHLRTKGRKYRKRGQSKDKRGQIIGRVDIDQRPVTVEEKSRIGDLEMDLVIGKDHNGTYSPSMTEQQRCQKWLRLTVKKPIL